MNTIGQHRDTAAFRRMVGGVSLLVLVALVLSSTSESGLVLNGRGGRGMDRTAIAAEMMSSAASVRRVGREDDGRAGGEREGEDHLPAGVPTWQWGTVAIDADVSLSAGAWAGHEPMGSAGGAGRVRVALMNLPPPTGVRGV
jgi:hypothetical protein